MMLNAERCCWTCEWRVCMRVCVCVFVSRLYSYYNTSIGEQRTGKKYSEKSGRVQMDVLSRHLPGEAEGNYRNPWRWYPVFRMRFEWSTSRRVSGALSLYQHDDLKMALEFVTCTIAVSGARAQNAPAKSENRVKKSHCNRPWMKYGYWSGVIRTQALATCSTYM